MNKKILLLIIIAIMATGCSKIEQQEEQSVGA